MTISYRRPDSATVVAVRSVSFDVHDNEKLVMLGPSGCGKSTLLSAVAGFLPISGGTITVDGAPVSRPSLDRIMVFQDLNQLLPWKSVTENVEFALKRRWPRLGRSARREQAMHYVELAGLGPQRDQFPHTLSGGQKQRVAIARSFAVKPKILLMDEPFGALDAITREHMQAQLNRLWEDERTTVLFVTHDVDEAVRLGHRVLVMTGGPGRTRALIDNTDATSCDDAALRARRADELRELLAGA